MDITFRPARRGDGELLLRLIEELARYEKLEDCVTATAAELERELFEAGHAEAVFALADGEEAGYALFFHNFSTFAARPGLYLEDLFVLPEKRGLGIGRALMAELERIARARGCRRFEWSCLDWNEPAKDFYRARGALPMEDWTVWRKELL